MHVTKYRSYDPSFREDALGLARRGDRPLSAVASSLGIPLGTLRHWYDQDMAKKRKKEASANADPSETPEQKIARLERENAALKRQNAQLEMDRAILKKAAAFFAKENE